MLAGLSGAETENSGDLFRYPPLTVHPGPPLHGPVPVTVASNSPATARAAARHGLPLMLGFALPVDARVELLDIYAETASEHGYDPGTVDHVDSMMIEVGASRAEARSTLMQGYVPCFTEVLAHAAPEPGQGDVSMPPGALEATLEYQALGTPEECIMSIQAQLARTGCRRFLAFVEGSTQRDRVIANIERCSREVLPHLA